MTRPGWDLAGVLLVVAGCAVCGCSSTESGPDAGDAGDASASTTTGPIGLAAMTSFDRLPYLRTAERALHESSHDRSGGNVDFSAAPNYLYLDGNGDKVLLDARGPGCVYRMWFTGQDPNQRIHVYFDDEPQPRVDMTFGDFFSGTKAPFLAPLVADDQVSSGGFVSYLPLPFAKAIRITASGNDGGASPSYYYNIDYHLFDPAQPVTTWTGEEDSAAARALWTKAGADPKDESNATTTSAVVSLAAGVSQTLLDVDGPGEIGAIEMSVAGVFPVRQPQSTDGGRAHQGTSSFTVKLDPANQGMVLQRRLDHGVADQTATVLVDGVLAGTWTDHGSDATNRWRDDSFPVPATLTGGKDSVQVRIQFVSSAKDWTEFYYWVFSRVNGAEVLTDELDVGDAAAEAAHAYAITQPTYSGVQTNTYPSPAALAEPLDDLWLRIWWDGDATPSVEAPVGALFAQGAFGPGFVTAIPAGMNADGTMYLFFPMPFAKHAKIELQNRSAAAIDDVWYEVLDRPFTDSFANVGAFHVAYAGDVVSTPGEDAVFLDVAGAGQIVGVVDSTLGSATAPLYLEGDEHAFVDDRRTASLQGTGTEDFFNGGWYFDKGEFDRPTHGWSGSMSSAQIDGRAMHRFFLSDAIPFRSHAHLAIQHGAEDDVPVTSSLLAYYYAQPTPRLEQTDALTVGDPSSESKHGYAVTGPVTFEGSHTYTFEEPDFTQLTASGRGHRGESRFTMTIDPANRGVLLRRLMDQSVGPQGADVYVDGALVERWYTPGTNASHAWRDDEVWLPAGATAGKSSIEVALDCLPSDDAWTEFGYEAYSISEPPP